MKKPSEILLEARERIAAPGRWTSGVFARNKRGVVTTPGHPGATCWCMLGAIYCSVNEFNEDGRAAERFIEHVIGPQGNERVRLVPQFNDAPGRTQLECVVVLEKAVLLAMSEGK